MDFSDFDFSRLLAIPLIPVVIFIVMLVHEWGHYLAARVLGIHVHEISIGAGRKVWERCKTGRPRISLHLYPLWAHVHIEDFHDGSRRLWQKLFVIAAGPAINIVFPFFLFFVFFSLVGQPATPPVLTGVEVGGPAAKAGLQPGDEILSVNDVAVSRFAEIKSLAYSSEKPSDFKVRRGARVFSTMVTPSSYSYTDNNGIDRKNLRLGVIWQHHPYALKTVRAVNGINTKGKQDKARGLIKDSFGRDAVLGLFSTDEDVHFYKVHITAASNPDIDNPGNEDYKLVFLGASRSDFYFRPGVIQNFMDAAKMNFDLLGKVAGLPRQLLPIDPEILAPAYAVTDPASWPANHIFKFIYVVALISVLLAFVNLLPLPRLDGSFLVIYILESLHGRPLSKRQQVYIMAGAFFALYFCVLFSNLDKLPRYLDSRIKKIQEFIHHNDE